MTEREKIEGLRVQYEATLARSAYPNFQAFIEAVQQKILQLSGVSRGGVDPESPRSGSARRRELPRLTQRPSRDLKPVFAATVTRARRVLDEAGEWDYWALLHGDYLPTADWTRRPVASTFAYWAPRISGKSKGSPIIRVNRLLQAPTTQISDDLLEFLVWHELCHQLTPGRGHDAEFRRLESMWPDFARLDHELDTVQERFDLGWPEPENVVVGTAVS